MPLPVWNDQYLTGDKLVDGQHQELFRLVTELHEAVVARNPRSVLGPTLERVARYTVEHFSTEERMMADAGYPGLEGHRKKHDALTQEARAIIAGYESGEIVLTSTLSQFLAGWIRHHINEEDKAMIAWLQKNRQPAA